MRDFFKFLWPSQNIWTLNLIGLFTSCNLQFSHSFNPRWKIKKINMLKLLTIILKYIKTSWQSWIFSKNWLLLDVDHFLSQLSFFPKKSQWDENRVELLSLRHNRKFIRHFLLWSKVASKAKKRSLKLRPKPRKEKKNRDGKKQT